MSQILENVRNVDPNNNDAVKEVVTAFFQNLLKHKEVNCNAWLRVLESIISRFPRNCAQHRSTIENYLVNFLDSSNYYDVILVAQCAHGLQQIRPSQDKAATAKNCWREQLSILCNAAHKLIEAIFSKTVDIYKNSSKSKKLDIPLLSNTPFTVAITHILDVKKAQESSSRDRNAILCNRLRNIFVLVQAMLVEIYPVAKPIQPQLILEVVVQALSVSSSATTDATEASTVKTQALRTIDAMISCLGPNLIPFSGLVFRCVMQTLRWSSDNPSEESRKVRCVAYNSLDKWLSTLHVHRVSDHGKDQSWEDKLTAHIVDDFTPLKKVVQLTMSNQFNKNLSKKARRKLANTMLQQSKIASHMPGEQTKTVYEDTNDEVANAALECAETLLTVCGIFLKPATHKVFHSRLVRECYSLDNYSPERALRLLRALEACRKNTPHDVPPPTQYLLQLYSTLVNSQSDEIKKFSSQALLDIRLHLHCSPPSLNFAIEAPADKDRRDGNRKRISEANVNALQKYLGNDRMSELSTQEEVITISDEPSKKKRREEDQEVADNISLSSDSAKSIEISDEDGDNDVDDIVLVEEENLERPRSEMEASDVPAIEDSSKNSQENGQPVTIIDEDTVDLGKETQVELESESSQSKQAQEINIHEAVTQIPTESASKNVVVDSQPSQSEVTQEIDIHNAKTQLPIDSSSETVDVDKSPVSLEIVYDPNPENGKVTVFEKVDDENLPSTNDTDDVQITCGQLVQDSQELDLEKNKTPEAVDSSTPNGTNGLEEPAVNENVENIEVKITTSTGLSLDEMLGDFVDETRQELES